MIQKFRKKPVVNKQLQWDGLKSTQRFLSHWMGDKVSFDYFGKMTIHTLEGDMHPDYCDRIICGVAGEFYSCKPDIFERTYEPADEKGQG